MFSSVWLYSFECLITKKVVTCQHCVNLIHDNVCIDYCVAVIEIRTIVVF